MKALIKFFAKQSMFSSLLTFLVIGFGLYTLTQIQREAFPNVQYDIITIYTIFPGAAPSEVEKLITNPIEQEIKEVLGIKKLMSSSTEGRSGIIVQLDPDQTTEAEAKSDIQDIIDRLRNLPALAEDPVVTVIESKIFPVIEVTASGGRDSFHLKEAARFLEDTIETIPQVARVQLEGEQEYEVRVEVKASQLKKYQISLLEVVSALNDQNMAIPGGVFTEDVGGIEQDVILRTEGQFSNVNDIKQTVLRSNDLGRPIVLGNIAEVRMALKKAGKLFRVNDKDSIRLIVSKKEKSDAIDLVDNVRALLAKTKAPVLEGIEIQYVNDTSRLIRRRLGVLSNNLLVGLLLVVLIMSLFLPFKVAVITSLGIPFSFLGAMIFFYSQGISLNLITMMGLIIVIGMLVDDAVVVTENAIRRMEKQGEGAEEAAIRGTQQIWRPVFASVMTTVLAFVPMTMMSGIFGKFVSYIPIGVICALVVSLVECYFVLPYHISRWVSKENFRPKTRGFKYQFEVLWSRYTEFYGGAVAFIARWRYGVVGVFFAIVVCTGVVVATSMKLMLFPPEGVEQFVVQVKAPVGTSLLQTKKLMVPIEKIVASFPRSEIKNFVTSLGSVATRPDMPPELGSHFGQIMIFLTPENSRDRSAAQMIEDMRRQNSELQQEKLSVKFERINPGPPVGKPINIGVQGDDYGEIMELVQIIIEKLKSLPGAKDVDHNYSKGKDQVIVRVQSEEARAVNLSVASIGRAVMAYYEGIVAGTIKKLDEEIDIRVSLPEGEKRQQNKISNIRVMNPQGRQIPLDRVATLKREKGIEALHHSKNKRVVTVSGEIDDKVTSATAISRIIKKMEPEFKKKFPNLTLDFGGEDQDTQESLVSLMKAFVMALILIYFLLILTFQSFIWPVIIILAIPLGVVSVIWALFAHNQPLSFMGMLGVVALAGVIVNNAIVMVDFVREQRRQGASHRKSIVIASKMRLRPIFLTTLTTVFGILPTAYGIGGRDPFVVPIAIALGWGMFIGSILSSFFLPAFIAILDDLIAGLGWLTRRRPNQS